MFDPRTVLLTYEDVIRLRDERDQVSRDLDELNAKYEALEERFDAICSILPEEARRHILGEGKGSASKSTAESDSFYDRWEAALLPLLRDVGHGLTTAGIRKRVEGQPIEEYVGFQGRNLYRAANRLVERGILVRDEDFYLLPGQEKPALDEGASVFATFSKYILEYLSTQSTPIPGRDIIAGLHDTEVGPALLEKHTYFYTVLSKLVAEGKLAKDGRTYCIAPKENEPSGVSPPNGSDAGSVFD